MKKSIEILAHLFLWVAFTAMVITFSNLYSQAKPAAHFTQHFAYVVFLEVFMGLIFFYTTFLAIPWARRKKQNPFVLAAILLFLLVVFAYPAARFGIWQVMSSIVPHLVLVFLALVFHKFADIRELENEKQTRLV